VDGWVGAVIAGALGAGVGRGGGRLRSGSAPVADRPCTRTAASRAGSRSAPALGFVGAGSARLDRPIANAPPKPTATRAIASAGAVRAMIASWTWSRVECPGLAAMVALAAAIAPHFGARMQDLVAARGRIHQPTNETDALLPPEHVTPLPAGRQSMVYVVPVTGL
jgi:hypothetical protein